MHKADVRRSATRTAPLEEENMTRLDAEGWKEALVMTSFRSSMLAGLRSTMLYA